MKTKIACLFLVLSFNASVWAQTVTVNKQYSLFSKTEDKKAFYPVFNEDGDKLLFTTESYQGLDLYDSTNKTIKHISDEPGAGYEPIFGENTNKIFYRKTSYKTGRKYDAIQSCDLLNNQEAQMLTPQRNLRQARNFHNGFIVSSDRKLLKATFGKTSRQLPVYVCSEDLKMVLYRSGKRTEINPIGSADASYLWISLSPDNKMILFTAVGKGTFICDLKGEILVSFGKLNAPVWYDNDFIVGMQDEDDGNYVTASKIMMMSVNGKLKKQISPVNLIAMFPSTSAKSSKVAYNTSDGSIHVVELTVNH